MNASIIPLDPARYVAHALHRGDRDWAETNCYVDVWIELLHALGLEPLAGLGFTLRVDLEADQWTFFKFPHDELFDLFGVDVIECNPWESVLAQTVHEVTSGRPVLIEVDAFHLPDTAGTTYGTQHVKTTIAVNAIHVASEMLGYFHNQAYHSLHGADFRALFRLDADRFDATHLPPFIEVAKLGASMPRLADARVETAMRQLSRAVRRMPADNPFLRYAARFDEEIETLRESRGALYHAYAFATFRQFGAAFSLAASHLSWLGSQGVGGLDEAAVALAGISSTAKTLQFRTARAAMAGKPLDATPQLTSLVDAWDHASAQLRGEVG